MPDWLSIPRLVDIILLGMALEAFWLLSRHRRAGAPMTREQPESLECHAQQDDIDQPGNRQPVRHGSGPGQSQQLRYILEEHANVGEGAPPHQFLGGVGLPGQCLHVRVAAHGDKLFAALVGAVPEALQ